MVDILITFVILALAVAAFIWNRLPVEVVALLVSVALLATGLVGFDDIFHGFGSPTIVLIAALFVVAEGIDAAGVTTWLGGVLVRLAGTSRTRLVILVMVSVALLTAVISVNGAVAALLPMIVVLCVRLGLAPSKLLLPMAFAAHAGSLLVLTGSPVNVLIAQAAHDAGGGEIRFFDYALVGLPVLLGTIVVVLLVGDRLLPERSGTAPRDLSDHPFVLRRTYLEDHDTEASHDDRLQLPGEGLINKEYGVAEVLVPPRSPLIGTRVYPGMVTESGALVILAHHRVGERVSEQPAMVKTGDILLLQGRWDALDEHTAGDDVILVDSPEALRRQAAPLGRRAIPALIILAAMVVMLTLNLIPAAVTCLLAAIAMVVTRVVAPAQAHRAMQWQTLILVAAMIPMSTAITTTGAAELVAHVVVDFVGGSSPYLYLLGLVLVTAILGQLISNTATALVLIPIGVSVAAEAGISPLTVLMAISVASAAAVITPVATAANLMVMEPAGYKFGDYWRLGGVVMIVYVLVAVVLVPVIWPFHP